MVASPITCTGEERASGWKRGHIFGERYEIVARLGSGGMGVVYRAVDRLSQDVVALKVVSSPSQHTDVLLESLRRELLISRKLSHANIVRIYDIGILDETAFVAM